jgi:agmatinase
VYEQTKELLAKDKLVGLLGGDHSTPLGYFKAQAEKHGEFGILQVDAHCDFREGYEGFNYSHASIMYNALNEIPELKQIVQVGVSAIFPKENTTSRKRTVTGLLHSLIKHIKDRMYEGESWKSIVDEIIGKLPQKVHISFDIDGLDPKPLSWYRYTGCWWI